MIDAIDTRELRDLQLFADLPEHELERLAGTIHRTTVPAGTLLLTASVPGDAIYFVVEGSLKVQLVSESGVELTIALLGPGEMVGEMSLANGHGRSANVITREETTLVWMERKAFLRSLDLSPALNRNLVRELTRRLEAANERLQALGTLDVTGRVARQLLELAERYGRPRPGHGTEIPLAVTQGEIAEMIAATRERVNQIVVRLKKAGVMSVDPQSRITLHRPDVLADLCRL